VAFPRDMTRLLHKGHSQPRPRILETVQFKRGNVGSAEVRKSQSARSINTYTIYTHIYESSTPSSQTQPYQINPPAHLHLHLAYQTSKDVGNTASQITWREKKSLEPWFSPSRFQSCPLRLFGRTKFITSSTTVSMFTNGGFVHSSTTVFIHTPFIQLSSVLTHTSSSP
jgi:hypothetical protein